MKSTREKVITAALGQIGEYGYAKATTKSIAEKAGVNELTIFRLFGSKMGLMEVLLETTIGPFIDTLERLSTTNELEHDLMLLAEAYATFTSRHQAFLIRILPEVSNSEIGDLVIPLQEGIIAHMTTIITRHKSALRDDLPIEDFIRAFLGPLLARAFLGHVLKNTDLDIKSYVRSYLYGYARNLEEGAESTN